MTEPVLVLTTVGTRETAETLADVLVHENLAACVSIGGPVRSVYRWQGAIERSEEYQLTIKSVGTNLGRIDERINSFHAERPDGYSLPELLVVPLMGGSAAYLAWLRENAQPG